MAYLTAYSPLDTLNMQTWPGYTTSHTSTNITVSFGVQI